MRKRNKLIWLFTILTLISLIVPAAFLQVSGTGGVTTVMEMFQTADAVNISRNKETPIEAKLQDGKKGVLFTAANEGAKVSFVPVMSGNFEIDFRVYSDVSYSETDWAQEMYINPYLDLREIAFTVTDINTGKYFTLYITGGEKWNIITPVARVKTGDSTAGLHYNGDATEENSTELKNMGGYYTRMWGTTFCNVARTSSSLTDTGSKSTRIGFDPNTMQVYGYHYGAYSSKAEKRLILDLNDTRFISGADTQSGYENYKVDMSFTSIAADKQAKVIIYSINGQSFAGNSLVNNIGPELYAKFKTKGVAKEDVKIPAPAAYDIIDGMSAFNGTVSVKDFNNQNIAVSGLSSGNFTEGCYFTPQSEGIYTICYKAADLSGVYGNELSVNLEVAKTRPESTYALERNYSEICGKDIVIGTGTKYPLYPAKAFNALSLDNAVFNAQITIYKDNVVLDGYQNKQLTEAEMFDFGEAGAYRFVYGVTGSEAVKDEKAFEITVSDTQAAFDYTDISGLIPKGSSFKLPKIKAALNGSVKDAVTELLLPDGSTLTQENLSLDILGDYTVKFRAVFDDKEYTFNKYFTVAAAPITFFTAVSDSYIEENIDTPSYYRGFNGIKITGTAEMSAVKYNSVINISNNTKNDTLLEFLVTPEKIGSEDFFELVITLTDARDTSNFVKISVYKGSWGNHVSYVKAGASGQRMAGVEKGKVNTGYNVGMPVCNSFTGEGRGKTISLAFDYAEKAIYAFPSYYPADGKLVCDMDNPNHFSKNTLWKGFSTGEVYMSMTMQSYQAVKASYIILNVNGNSMAGNWIQDTLPPDLFIDYEGYQADCLPHGVINKPYKLFNVLAYDKLDGVISGVNKEVYYNYGLQGEEKCDITDNKFMPAAAGIYTIVYSCTDQSGNTKVSSVNITVEQTLEEISLHISGDIAAEASVGGKISLPEFTVSGGSGNKTVFLLVKEPYGGGVFEIKNNSYLPLKQGVYKIIYRVSDFLETKDFVYTQNALISKAPVISLTEFPQYLINGMDIILPQCTAIDYYSDMFNPRQALVKIFVSYNGVTEELNADRKFRPAVSADMDTVSVKYVAYSLFNKEYMSDTEITVPVKKVKDDSGNLSLEKYFDYSDNVSVEKYEESLLFKITQPDEEITFIKELPVNNFLVKFNVPANYNSFDCVNVILTDSADPSLRLAFKIRKNSSSSDNFSYISLNGGEEVKINGSFYGNTFVDFVLIYDNISYTVKDANQIILMTINEVGGREFKGFTGGRIKLGFSAGNISDVLKCGIEIKTICNQVFGNLDADYVPPVVQLKKTIEMSYEIGERIILPAAVSIDILDTFTQLTVSAESPDGNFILKNQPIDVERSFIASQYGEYGITYNAFDGSGQKKALTFKINVYDRIPPVLTVNGTIKDTAKTGAKIELPKAEATDNYSQSLKVYVFIILPDNSMVNYDSKMTFDQKGIYTVRYYVRDGNYNYCIKDFNITVN